MNGYGHSTLGRQSLSEVFSNKINARCKCSVVCSSNKENDNYLVHNQCNSTEIFQQLSAFNQW